MGRVSFSVIVRFFHLGITYTAGVSNDIVWNSSGISPWTHNLN